ncbi:hypothetical protein [uncultured Cetobacterium sp.]|uniref:hypothetical protein n=1 Tax=uncultured Cetobacterium sp. TaxID=527638 RepID=UPI0026086906|nr:hypothetical protein [uncultured Cetobacterium sp.]
MKKIKVKIINCSVYYNNKEYKKDEILEIDERFFRDDCMEKENELESKTEKNIDKEISKENLENYPLTIKELKEFRKNNFQME